LFWQHDGPWNRTPIAPMTTTFAFRKPVRSLEPTAAAPPANAGAGPLADMSDAELALMVLQEAPYPIYVKDLQGRFRLINPTYVEFCGPGGESVLGRTSAEAYDPQDAAGFLAHDRAAIESDSAVVRESVFRGQTYHTVKFPIHDAAGTAIGVVGIDTDMTVQARREAVLRESEKHFRDMADSVPALIWTSDRDCRCSFVNKQWIAFTGRTLERELHHGFAECIHPDDRAHTVDKESELFATRAPGSAEYRLRRADGAWRWFLDTWAPRFAPDGSFLGFIGTMVDVTDRKILEESLSRIQRLEAIGRLTGGVAHDFNNLLTVIVGNLEMLRDASAPQAPAHAFTQTALSAAMRGSALTQRLLSFSRHQTLDPRSTDVSALIEQVCELLRRTLGEDIVIGASVAAGLWPAVVDGAELEHALLNLAVNSRDAMPGGGTLTITACNLALDEDSVATAQFRCAPGDYLAISVVDTGTGMIPEVAQSAVEPFFTTKEVGKGSGLGLSMAYGFCQQSAGDLRIDSTPGRGTTMTLYLPRAGSAASGSGAPSNAFAVVGGRETILVVEDDREVRVHVVGCLAALGYEVIQAVDGDAALRMVASHPKIDLLFTDIVMPGGLNGRELADRARALCPRLRVLLTSGYAAGGHGPVGGSHADVLAKPYLRHVLARRIRDTLDASVPEDAAA
jgi:PAS domain S-box-containing protein